jgi:hypothetical protein
MTMSPNIGRLVRFQEAAVFDQDMVNWHHYDQPVPMASPLAMTLLNKGADLWRINFNMDGKVDLLFIGMSTNEKKRDCVPADGLPEWMKDRIAVLNTFGANWPTDYIDGVGRRISERTYYVEE